jgi:hypothetical protein
MLANRASRVRERIEPTFSYYGQLLLRRQARRGRIMLCLARKRNSTAEHGPGRLKAAMIWFG